MKDLENENSELFLSFASFAMIAKDKAQIMIMMSRIYQVVVLSGLRKLVQEYEALGFFMKKWLGDSRNESANSTAVDLRDVAKNEAPPMSAIPSKISFIPPFQAPS